MADDGLQGLGVDGPRVLERERWVAGEWLVRVAVVLMLGIGVGRWTGAAWVGWWIGIVGGLGLVWAVWRGADTHRVTAWGTWGSKRVAVSWVGVFGLVTVLGLGWAWYGMRVERVSGDDVRAWTVAEGQLVSMRGVVASEPRSGARGGGAMAAFDYRRGRTLFELEVEAMQRRGAGDEIKPSVVVWRETRGRVLVSVSEPTAMVERGQRVALTGWLSEIGGPANPGEFDFAALMRDRGVTGRVTVSAREALEVLADQPGGLGVWVERLRSRAAAAADRSLSRGFVQEDAQLGLLRALLLGRRAELSEQTHDQFRRVGLAHILSISGAHLGVLLGMVWLVARVLTGRPRRSALIVLVVLGLFVLAVPMRTPIVRAAVMAGLFCMGALSGRRVSAVGLLALSCVLVLLWKPADLFNAGFQLSFAAVLGILLFTEPVMERVWPKDSALEEEGGAWWLARKVVEAFVVGGVAFLSVTPMVMLHFGLLSPLAVVLSTASILPLGVLLAVGYVKVLVGMVLPSVSLVLAGPLRWLSGVLTGLVEEASGWPGSGIEVVPPGWWWVLGATGFGAAVMGGVRGLGWRGWRLWVGMMVLGVWFGVVQWTRAGEGGGDEPSGVVADWVAAGERSEPMAEVLMLSVGDGSCFVVRCGGEAMMFDCGSQQYTGIGIGTVVPTLRAMGVGRLSAVVVSHADLDHFGGVLDVVDRVAVGRVLVSPDVRLEAAAVPSGAAAFLLAGLAERGVEVEEIGRGWRGRLGRGEGAAAVEVLWPDVLAVSEAERSNDRSLVMRFTVGGRRVLLAGDIGERGKARLLALEEAALADGGASLLRADVVELPHHGAYEERVSERWLRAVGPGLVLQSSGRRRAGLGGVVGGEGDPWTAVLAEMRSGAVGGGGDAGVERLVSGLEGMVRVGIWADGAVRWRTHGGGRGVLE
ncbi:MAG: ComEC/Rec2 family competence protein [Planctomycetota bacterium]